MAQTQKSTVVGVFDDYTTAERTARQLENQGIPRESIDVKSNFMTGAAGRGEYGSPERDKEGGISGFFHRLFGGEPDVDDYGQHYAEAVRRGSAVVCVTAEPEQLERAASIMNENGAVDIDRRVAAYREGGYRGYDPAAPPYTHEESMRERERLQKNASAGPIPVVEEELQVGKRVIRKGGVRVYSTVTEHPVEESVTLREEHVRVERRPADRPLQPGEASRLGGENIEVTEMGEEPVVSKKARVREEVIIGKETTERTEKVRDSVRRTEVNVDRIGEDRETGSYRDEFRRHFDQNYAGSGNAYQDYEPAYEYGRRMAADPRYRGKKWSDVDQNFRTDYSKTHPEGAWERMKDAVRYGWENVTGRRD